MKLVKVKISELRRGPLRHDRLPDGFIIRVQKCKEILKEVETTSLEEAIGNFQRDLHPENELIIWEDIARNYQEGCENNPNWTLAEKEEMLSKLLSAYPIVVCNVK